MLKRISWRNILAISILVVTIGIFIVYISKHPEVRQQIQKLDPRVLALLLALYILFIGALSQIISASVRLCRISLSKSESLLLTMYSSVINFFGPLQSGPAFRAVYLKQKHNVKLKDYTAATFMYYLIYAFYSLLLLFSGLAGRWIILALLVITLGFIILKTTTNRLENLSRLNLSNWYYLALATLLQIVLLLIIFWIELTLVSPNTSFSQVAIYTGAANLALFVSITPGAIGFREFFLVSTQNLHHIDNGTIVAANTIDRAVYVLLLLILTVFITATHTKRRLLPNS